MRRVVSLLPHWSTDRLRRKTAKPPPERGMPPAPPAARVTAVQDHGRRIVASVSVEARALVPN